MAKRGRKPRVLSLDGLVAELKSLDERRHSIVSQIRSATESLLSGLGGALKRRGRPPATVSAGGQKRKRRKMSAAARKAIGDAQRARWAKQKKAAGKIKASA